MFDEQNSQSLNNQSSAPARGPQPNNPPTPPAVPVAPAPKLTAMPQTPQVEDIFSQTDPSAAKITAGPSAWKPGTGLADLSSSQPSATAVEEIFGGRKWWQSPVLTWTLIIAVLALIGGAGFWAFNFFRSAPQPAANGNQQTNQPAAPNQTPNNQPAATNQDNNADNNKSNQTPVAEVEDSDNDGLSDAQEKNLGTKPNNFDSDSDGLNDGTEINIYKTDPLIADTDGDGYKDGEEVVNSYDPNIAGSAKLYSVPQYVPNVEIY